MDMTAGTVPGMIRIGLTTVGPVHSATISEIPGITDGAVLTTIGIVLITDGTIPTLRGILIWDLAGMAAATGTITVIRAPSWSSIQGNAGTSCMVNGRPAAPVS